VACKALILRQFVFNAPSAAPWRAFGETLEAVAICAETAQGYYRTGTLPAVDHHSLLTTSSLH
jgi:hypothetical protein